MDRSILELVDKIKELLPKAPHSKTPMIIQLVPVTVEKWAKWKEDNGSFSYSKVELWALVQEHDGERYVHGMESGEYMDFIEDVTNFVGYVTKEQMENEIKG